MIQGGIISPVLFILELNRISNEKKTNEDYKGVKCGRILIIKTLVYADDVALTEKW